MICPCCKKEVMRLTFKGVPPEWRCPACWGEHPRVGVEVIFRGDGWTKKGVA